ncbi:hypothetical protein [Microbacterium sp. 13-71-7]|jgi:hypothetical protein|uniref:hypothetical protein n=1 Tax=Microbacterium sp. 13-71-7 TaxID=1970399 RepID=UPI000BD53879|nr:hypothetical protein [Microbacterium sp. 13-71-7]OZB85737.1 MAG: hypothetical protein B7X32_02390 [Microbacterium sp. 13-71-7]
MDISTVAAPPDFTPITDQLSAMAPLAAAALGAVLGSALAVMAIKWGAPLIIGFFKKSAK